MKTHKSMSNFIVCLITTKNRESFISALQSATNQTREPDRIVVVSDSDEDYVAQEQSATEKVGGIYLRDRHNHARNYAGSLNMGIDYVVQRYYIQENMDPNQIYIATLDDDDQWHQDYIKECSAVLVGNPDFVVTGLNYCEKDLQTKLSIPQELSVHSFLRGNPHIQGSNTFVKLSTLMKAGCFDESMPSTTDRDVFVRIMQQDPRFAVVNKHLVNIDVRNEKRITTNREVKLEGLRLFYRKYHFLMDLEDREAFHKRNFDLFGISENEISAIPTIPVEVSTKPKREEQRYEGNLIVGIIVTFEEGAKRLVEQLHSQLDGEYEIVLFNNTGKNLEWDENLMSRVKLVDEIGDKLSIAVARQKLQEHIYYRVWKDEKSVCWLLDDDMELKQLLPNDILKPLDIRAEIPAYLNAYDAVIGTYTNDAPLPLLSSLRLQLLDCCYSRAAKMDSHDPIIESLPDHYYSLTDSGYKHLECPFYNQNFNFENIFQGYSQTRQLVNKSTEVTEARNRGGNTLVFNKDMLLLPTCSLEIRDVIARRGDFFWVLTARNLGFRICQGTFSTYHNRQKSPFKFDSEMKKLMQDIIGSSMTKAIERTKLSMEDLDGDKKILDVYTEELYKRLSRFIQSYYRIIGLLHIAADTNYVSLFSEESLRHFVSKIFEYSGPASIDAAFRALYCKLSMAESKMKMPMYRSIVSEYLGVSDNDLSLLGQGNEGCVFHNGHRVYKLFTQKNIEFEFLRKVSKSFEDCPFLSPLDFIRVNDYLIISRRYEKGETLDQCKASDYVKLLLFGKEHGFCFNNLKPDNFIQTPNGLLFIDYGKDIIPYNDQVFERSVERTFQVFRYYFLKDSEFKELISLSYAKKADAINSGLEVFKRMFDEIYKEDIHDTKVIATIKGFHPNTVLDYGAGKCKIANQLYESGCQVDVFDINQEQMEKRALDGVEVLRSINKIKREFYDVVNCNQVLCWTESPIASSILQDISRALKPNGHLVLSICNPFFTDVQHTMLRGGGRNKGYYDASTFQEYTSKMKPIDGLEQHRPVDWYERALRKFGFAIIDTYETDGINTDNALTIGEHLVFICQKVGEYVPMQDLSLLIKTCAMDASTIYENIRHIVTQLEYGCGFEEKVVCVDGDRKNENAKQKRVRAYAEDDYPQLIAELARAKNNGLIDRIVLPDDLNTDLYQKYFGRSVSNIHSQNGQPLLMTLNGFEEIHTPFVFQTDCDILFYNNRCGSIAECLSDFRNSDAVTMSLSICQEKNAPAELGHRTEVRNCFLNLPLLNQLLPLENGIENGCFTQTWHRCLDKCIASTPGLSIRCHNKNLFFIHIENGLKNDADLMATVRCSIERGFIPDIQKGNVNLKGVRESWIPTTNASIVVTSRGKNTSVDRVKRMLDSLGMQENVNFSVIYTDAYSSNVSEEYASFRLRYEQKFRGSVFIPNKTDHLEIDMLSRAIQTISNDDTIIITVDNDDYLLRPDAMQIIVEKFREGADYVCGNNIRYDKPLKDYKISGFDRLWERNGDNIWLHPICFTKALFKKVNPDDMKIDGEWINICTDYAYAVPMIQLADFPTWIETPIYFFEPSLSNRNKEGNYRLEKVDPMRNEILQRAKIRYEKDNINYRR